MGLANGETNMYFAHHYEIYRRLGLDPKRHLPPYSIEPQVINVLHGRHIGHDCTLPVFITPPAQGKHRVLATCKCGFNIPVGRLGQHRLACEPLRAASTRKE